MTGPAVTPGAGLVPVEVQRFLGDRFAEWERIPSVLDRVHRAATDTLSAGTASPDVLAAATTLLQSEQGLRIEYGNVAGQVADLVQAYQSGQGLDLSSVGTAFQALALITATAALASETDRVLGAGAGFSRLGSGAKYLLVGGVLYAVYLGVKYLAGPRRRS